MGRQRGGSKTDMIVKLALVVFISLLSFSVGTYVGKQVSDSENKRLALEGDFNSSRDVASAHSEKTEEEKLSDEEVASLQEEFLNDEKSAATTHVAAASGDHQAEAESHETDADGYSHYGSKGATAHKSDEAPAAEHSDMAKAENTHDAKTADAHEARNQHHDVAKSAHRVAEGKAPAADPKERAIASTLPSDPINAAAGKYTVQIASYGTEGEAKNHASSLMKKGYSAFYLPATVRGQTWYRVSVGLYSDQDSAMKFQQELKSQGGVSSSIVQKIVK